MQNFSPYNFFQLNPGITFLNFGSFGSCPRPIFQKYLDFQLEQERDPVQVFMYRSQLYLEASRKALGAYINCHPDDVVMVPNPSYAVNIITRSLELKPGDEILSTNLEYGACDKAWTFICRQTGAKYIRQPITLPLSTKEKIVEDFFKGCTPKTKIIFISHITSATALILPVKEICAEAKKRGLLTFVDGAHAPGHIALNLQQLEADIYTGACHKWMMTPKGSSFLYVCKQLQPKIMPLVVSWGYDSAMPSHSQFLDYHQVQGTRDLSAFFTIPAAIQFMQENNWVSISEQCKQIVRHNALRFCDLIGSAPLCAINNEFVGQMFSIPVLCSRPEELQKLLYTDYKIEIPVMRLEDKVFIRYSINAFNTQEDLDKLYAALKDIIRQNDLIQSLT